MDRYPGTGEILELLRIVLVAEDMGWPSDLQGGADAIGADRLLGVAESGRKLHAVEVAVEIVIRRHPAQHDPVGVGQDHANWLTLQALAKLLENRESGTRQWRVEIGIAHVGQ